MPDTTKQQARRLFMELADLADPERTAALVRACGDNATLRNEVEALLRADRSAGGFLSSPTAADARRAATPSGPSSSEAAGEQIGRYKLLEQIGEGGMGTIWMAEQREPVKRRVALKIIKLGMDTKQVIARVEAERQALAMMDHPNIAKVLDAGATETGRPYFVMEYIKGIPILEYCDQAKVDTEARLQLFTNVCHAIQHAHQKGIIHRDIKPSNVLVTLHDGLPVCKVIDFGIAKATNSELTTKTLFTEHRQMVGTPAYMSPEQAEMSGLDIDTRSDIYSLGVLLYELLTGTTPFDMKALLESGFAEMMRTIREVEPHKPSTRISTLGDTASRTAQQRHVDVKKLSSLLRGDIDWIVMKCLEKDRSRRYETSNGLAADIQRHLKDEPVTAGAPGAAYKLRKFARRHRGQVFAAGIVAAALVLGVIGTTMGMMRALDEKQRADAAAARATLAAASEARANLAAQQNAEQAIAAATLAEAAKNEEAKARMRAETISEFVTTALQAGDAQNEGGGQDMTILAAMDNAIADIDAGRFRGDPEVEAQLKGTIGMILLNNGRLQQAEPLLAQALEMQQRLQPGDHQSLADALDGLARVRRAMGRSVEAEGLCVLSLAMNRRLFRGDSPNVATALNSLAQARSDLGQFEAAESLFIEALQMFQRLFDGDNQSVAAALNNVATVRQSLGRFAAAEPLSIQSLEMLQRLFQGDHPSIASGLHNLAGVRGGLGRHAEAEPLLVQALAMNQRLYKGDHPSVAASLRSLARARHELGRLEEAEQLHVQALAMNQRVYRGDHPTVAIALNDLANVRQRLGRHAEAESLLIQALAMNRRLYQGDHADIAHSLKALAVELQQQGRCAEAEPLSMQALEMEQRLYQGDHVEVAGSLNNVAFLRMEQGDAAGAKPVFLQALQMNRRMFPGDHASVAFSLQSLASAHGALGESSAARALLEEALAMLERLEPRGSALQARVLWKLGSVDLAGVGAAAALPRLEAAVVMGEAHLGSDRERLQEYRDTLVRCRAAIGAQQHE